MLKRLGFLVVTAVLGMQPLLAQNATQQVIDPLGQAQIALRAAEEAGAQNYAKSLYDDAAYRIRFAQDNWHASKASNRDQAQLRALEGLWAARAALAKAQWLGTNAAVRSLQSDIVRFGGAANVTLADEPSDLPIERGTDSRMRIAFAQGIVDSARLAGGDRVDPADLATAQTYLDSARKITKNNASSESADYLAYVSEMMGRRALYTARSAAAAGYLAPFQLQRTQLAQAESERSAAAERAQREEAERQRQALQMQLAAEQANRQAQAAELDRLREQLDANRRAMQAQVDQDRLARTNAEEQVDLAFAAYQTAVTSGSATDIENARRTLEDRQIALRSIQQREQLNEQAMASEIDRLRNQVQMAQQQGAMPADVIAQRQSEIIQRQQEIEAFRSERSADAARRAQLDQQRQAAIADAQRRRADTEAQAQLAAQQLAAAQQAAQQAQQAAAAAQQQAQQTQAELEKTRAQTQAELEKSQQAQADLQKSQEATRAELEKTRQQLAQREAETQRLRMEQELARIAATRKDERGFIVTLSSALFDTGKSTLKAGAKSTLRKIAAQLKSDPGSHIAVEGHTDSVGSDAANLALSEKRANAVRDFLVAEGIAETNVTAAGKGEAEPVATNKTVAGRQQNRRVELIVTKP